MKFLNKLINNIIFEYKNNIQYLYFIIIIIFFIAMQELFIDYSYTNIKNIIATAGLLFFLSLSHRVIFFFFAFCILFLNTIRIHLALHWGKETALYDFSSRIAVSLESPSYERFEYLQSYIDYRDYISIIYTATIVFLLFLIPKYKQYTFNILRLLSIVFSIFLIFLLHKQFPFVIIRNYKDVSSSRKIILERNKYIQNIPHRTTKNDMIYDKVIWILGESANSKYLNVYGYKANTTPFLSNLYKNKKLYKFNAISGANLTRRCIPMLFTQANVLNWRDGFTHSQSIISDFKNFGYKTYWISNQGKVGRLETFILNIAKEADNTIFLNKSDHSHAKPDIEMISYLNSKIQKNSSKEMYVLHLIGSHFKYSKRVTEEIKLHKNPHNIVEEYENTIYYTDYIIKNIFKYFDNSDQKILIIYVSDHGEVVNQNKVGHGFNPAYKDEYKVPFLVYSNIKNKKIDYAQSLIKEQYINTENINNFILYISGLSNDANISYSKKVFTLNPKNILNFNYLKNYKEE